MAPKLICLVKTRVCMGPPRTIRKPGHWPTGSFGKTLCRYNVKDCGDIGRDDVIDVVKTSLTQKHDRQTDTLSKRKRSDWLIL